MLTLCEKLEAASRTFQQLLKARGTTREQLTAAAAEIVQLSKVVCGWAERLPDPSPAEIDQLAAQVRTGWEGIKSNNAARGGAKQRSRGGRPKKAPTEH